MPIDSVDSLLAEGIELALFGMGTVFLFLGMLIIATVVMSKIALRLAPLPTRDNIPYSVNSPQVCDDECIAVVGAAVIAHRARGTR